MTIKTKLTILIGLLVVVASVAVGGISVLMSIRIIMENTEEWMESEAKIAAMLVNASIQNRFDILREISITEDVRSMNFERQRTFLLPYTHEMDFDEFVVIDMNYTARFLGGSVANLSNREYVQQALKGENTLSDVISTTGGAVSTAYPVINFVVPIKSEDNRILGGLLGRVNALSLSELLTDVKARGDSYSFMVNKDAVIIAHTTRPEIITQSPAELSKTEPMFSSLATAIEYMISKPEGDHTHYNVEGKDMMCAFMPVGKHNMIVAITADEASLMYEVNNLRNLIVVIVAVFMVIGLLAAIYIANFIARRLKNVQNTVTRLGSGDFSKYHKVLVQDEIGAIADALNKCMDSIKHLVSTIKERGAMLSDTGKQLSDDMTKTTDAMNHIDRNMENINNRMENQSASVIETSSTMRQIITTINKLSDNVESQSQSVAQSSSAIEEMLANIQSVTQTLIKNTESVKTLARASDAGRSGLQEVASDIQEIARESEGLMEINSVMENIAGQTNLLSMNAAIEAAHAGDAGKGFAVVADEIRKLAESSSEQSKTISGVLKKIKESIDKITLSTNTVLTKFEDIDKNVKVVSQQEDNIRISMEEQSSGSKQILEAIGKLNELTRHVKGSSDEMREGSKQVITESENLEQVTAEITNAMKEMGDGTHQIGSAVKRVNETATQNEGNIGFLVKEVEKFKVE